MKGIGNDEEEETEGLYGMAGKIDDAGNNGEK